MSVLNQSGEEQVECPLCMEPLEVDDLNFFPCTCGYQICRFCWHRIRTDENGLCPACRKAYPEDPADFKPLSREEVAKLKAEKRQKDQARKQKISENRKHLANVRVVQKNLVFVVGLPLRLADPETLKKHDYFGKFGKIHKVVINQSTSYAGSQGPSASAYVTYLKSDDALRAIQTVNNIAVDGRTVKTSLGTTKYCSHFMKNQPCPKPDCMYLHELGDPEASFTKEEMQQGKHQEYEKKLHEQLLASTLNRKPSSSPPTLMAGVQPSNGAPPPSSGSSVKEAWPSLNIGCEIGSEATSSSPPTDQSVPLVTALTNGGSSGLGGGSNNKSIPPLERKTNGNNSTSSKHKNRTETTKKNKDPSVINGCSSNKKSSEPLDIPYSSSKQELRAVINGENLSEEGSSGSSGGGLIGQGSRLNELYASPTYQHLAQNGFAAPDQPPLPDHTNSYGHFNGLTSTVRGSLTGKNGVNLKSHQNLFDSNLSNSSSSLFFSSNSSSPSIDFAKVNGGCQMVNGGLIPTDWTQTNGVSVHHAANTNLGDLLIHPQGPGLGQQQQQQQHRPVENGWQASFGRSTGGGLQNSHGSPHRDDDFCTRDDDLGFDPFHETQKALAEMIEKEEQHRYQPKLIVHHNNRINNCSKLLEGLRLGSTVPHTRPPPPGFTSTPNHMNAFGLGIPRTGNKTLPFVHPAMAFPAHTGPSAAWDWSSLDPAIVTSAQHCDLYSATNPPPGFSIRQTLDNL